MEESIRGKAYVLGDNIDTDQIIPAHYLMYNPAIPEERRQFGRYALSGVPAGQNGLPGGNIPFVDQTDPSNTRSEFSIVIGGKNFGCGSSREHAPLALAEAGIKAVVAEFYARIFFRNSVNGGYLIPYESVEGLVGKIHTGDDVEIRPAENVLINHRTGERHPLKPLGEVAPIIEAGGIFEYAKQAGML
ncbi:MAG TPA: 3-isopropylmalate dehydratase [Phycisphaerae bacterium]|jgi:3-isopropylmalate/(R)-2-methylmalate dehydratase small subunit|nr:3-isopropylmalate dehydratase [Phycisphaerae bacterium]HOJ54883.1 3-isopropylmalate dehydratase [Phycisphaerae bacterium]HOL26069.1 3-isopropylmalate dehydratase [Phycisphaerae bacterium]HPP21523.1 3-isopropylmalate dehydratase [Phycisphaerae bacterium]HPU31501.1 3-isopropylmalate dehydratase [Phycisphaerae bacterium]